MKIKYHNNYNYSIITNEIFYNTLPLFYLFYLLIYLLIYVFIYLISH